MSAPAPQPRPEPLRRELSLLGLWLLIVNGMFGAGIFGLPAEAARLAGAMSPWIFLICAGLILPVVLAFSQLASHFGNTGGPMLYATSGFGPFVGFQAGWALYVARLTAFAANLNLLVATLAYFWPGAAGGATRTALLFSICAVFVAVNVVGTRDAMRSLGLLTLLKFLPLLILVLFGLQYVEPAVLAPGPTPLSASNPIGPAILLVIYAYVGFESGLVPAGEARKPQRDMPRALLAALLTVSLLYTLIQWVAVAVLADLATSARPLVAVGEVLLGPPGALLIMAGIAVSVGGNLLGSMFTTPRITYRLALDGQLPRWFGRVHPDWHTPVWSIVVYGLLGFVLALHGSFAWLAALSVVTRVLLYLTCIAALPRIRAAAGTGAGPGLASGPVIPAVAALVCLGLLTQVTAQAWLLTAAFLGAGSLLFGIAQFGTRRN